MTAASVREGRSGEASAFQVIPAIDLQEGRCVRLLRGERDQETVYGSDPAGMAGRWVAAGAGRLHVVDLDGAFEGVSRNLAAIEEIIAASAVPVQVGGGLRSADAVARLFELGADRVIVGTRAVEEPAFLKRLLDRHGERILVSVDVRAGRVAVRGWTETAGAELPGLLARLKGEGVTRLIVTDITRDGTLAGPDTHLLAGVAAAGFEVLAAGGIGSLADLQSLRGVDGVVGAIVGRAIYTGDIELAAAIAAMSAAY